MFKRSNANYSLWPEQARPRRGLSLSLAAGGFAVGIVCAIAVVNVASDFVRPVAMEAEPEPVQRTDTARPIPVYSAASALAVGKAPDHSDSETARNRTRLAAKTALPSIGRAVPVVSETDGRGGDSAVKTPAPRLTSDSAAPATKADAEVKLRNDTKLLREDTSTSRNETKVAAHDPSAQAAEPQAPEAAAQPEEAKPAAAKKRSTYRRSKPRRTQEARKPERRRPTYAAPYRAGPIYGYTGAPVYGYSPY